MMSITRMSKHLHHSLEGLVNPVTCELLIATLKAVTIVSPVRCWMNYSYLRTLHGQVSNAPAVAVIRKDVDRVSQETSG